MGSTAQLEQETAALEREIAQEPSHDEQGTKAPPVSVRSPRTWCHHETGREKGHRCSVGSS